MMATYDNLARNAWAYENLDSLEKKEKKNTSDSESLLKCKEPLRWYVGGLMLYTISILAIIGWGYSGPVYAGRDRKSTRLNSSHPVSSRMPSSA